MPMGGKSLTGSIRQQVEQVQTYSPRFNLNAAALALTAPQLAALDDALSLSDTAYQDHLDAMLASKAATQDWYDKANEAITIARGLIKSIKAKAQVDDNPELYVLSGIPVPDTTPTPSAPPSAPSDFAAAVTNTGYVQLTWKGTRSSLITTNIWRRLANEASYTMVGAVTGSNWTDTTVPAGTTTASYYGVAVRKGQSSEPTEIVMINFGQLQVAA